MHMLRQRAAARLVRPVQRRPAALTPAAVRFASHSNGDHHDHHDHHEAPAADEPIGSAFFIALAAIPLSYAVYTFSRPGKDGEPNALEAYFNKLSNLHDTWETRNTVRTAMYEQAAHDKNLLYTIDRNTHVELRAPELFQSGSQYNVPAGHYVNLDKVVAHYKTQYENEAERQAKAAEASAAAAAAAAAETKA